MKLTQLKSPNFSEKKRNIRQIKLLILHYTGMQSARVSIKRLTSPKHKVSCHYLINREGKVFRMVEDNRVAWHAGKSKWGKFVNLNDKSIGIELVNKGHKFGYQKFSKKQISALIQLCIKLKKKYSIKNHYILGHSDIAPLRKSDPGEKFPWKKLNSHGLGKWYKKNNINIKINTSKIENLFFKNIKKLGYNYFSVHKKSSYDKKIIKSFQMHYLPNNVTGKIDQKTFKISHFLSI